MNLTEKEERALYIGLLRDFFKGDEAQGRERLGLPPDWERARNKAMYIIQNLNGTYPPPGYSEDE